MGKIMRDFKSNLNKYYVKKKKKPVDRYKINPDQWKQFSDTRESDDFKV